MSPLQIREARADDFTGVLRLYRQLHPEDPVLTDGRDESVFRSILAAQWLRIFVAEEARRIVSTCYLNIVPNVTRSARPYAIIENVVTDEQLRGKGLGRRVMQHALEFAWKEGCYKAMLQTGSKQESTHAFYRACGFRADEKTGYIARPG
ncbi:MAG TPA: GNAT family N-acetyltransferase [Pseudomonadales bacterium]